MQMPPTCAELLAKIAELEAEKQETLKKKQEIIEEALEMLRNLRAEKDAQLASLSRALLRDATNAVGR